MLATPRSKKAYARDAQRATYWNQQTYRCTRCQIRISARVGLCEDCAQERPLILYADGMGADRFFQTRTPRGNLFADVDGTRAGQLRQWRQTPKGKAHSARRHARAQ